MAEQKSTILLQLELNAQQLIKNLLDSKDKAAALKVELAETKAQLLQLDVQNQQGTATYINLQKAEQSIIAEQKRLNSEINTNTRLLGLNQSINKDNIDSLSGQQRLLSVLTAEYNSLSEAERNTSEKGIALNKQINEITDNLKSQEEAVGNSRRNVGNYAEAIKQAATELGLSKNKVNDLKLQIQQLNDTFKQGGIDEQNFNAQLKELTDELNIATSQSDELGQKVDQLKQIVTDAGEVFKPLRLRLREAREEAQKLQEQFEAGLVDEQTVINAQQRVADLSEEVGDFQKRIDALNPEAKFKAFTQVASGLAGGIGVVSGAMGLLGDESDDAAQALLKVQQFMQFTQGLNQLAELGDSLKNLRIVLGLTTVATRTQTAAQQQQNVAAVEGAVAVEGVAAAENVATTSTIRWGVAIRGLLITSGLILLPAIVIAATSALELFSDASDEAVESAESLAAASDANLVAAKRTLEVRAEGIKREQELSKEKLDLMKAEGASESELVEFKKRSNGLIQGLQDDAFEANKRNIERLDDLRKRSELNARLTDDKDDKKTLEDKAKSLEDEIKLIEKANNDILTEQRKADNELLIESVQLAEKKKQIEVEASQVRIGLIDDLRKREIASEQAATAEKIRQLQKAEQDNSELISALLAESAQKQKEINLKFDLQEVEERNQLQINATREGTLERIAAEGQAAQRVRDIRIQDESLTAQQIEIIEQDLSIKLRALEDQRLEVIERNNQTAIELFERKKQAELDIQSDTTFGDGDKALLSTLNQINFETQAKIEAKEREADALKAAAQNEITDREELAARIKQIDETIAAEKLSILQRAAADEAQVIRQAEQDKLDAVVEFKQLQLEASNPEEEFARRLELLDAQQDAELQAALNSVLTAEEKEQRIEQINKKYAKAKMTLDDAVAQNFVAGVRGTLSQAASLFKKHTAAYKVLASAQVIIDTYASATSAFKAMAGIPYVGPVLGAIAAGVAIASGLANLSKINSVETETSFEKGGYTEKGDYRQVSTSHSNERRTIHKDEYVVDHVTLHDPVVSNIVENVIERKRVNKSEDTRNLLSLSMDGIRASIPTQSYSSSFMGGGYVPPTVVQSNTNQPISIDTTPIAEQIAQIPTVVPVLVVPDVTQVQGDITKVESRASW